MAFRSPSFEAVQEAHIGNVVLGRAPVKIISSICAATVEEMIEQAKAIDASGADIIEWRADYYADDASWQKAATAMKAVVSKPILYTFRSQSEAVFARNRCRTQPGARRYLPPSTRSSLMLSTLSLTAAEPNSW